MYISEPQSKDKSNSDYSESQVKSHVAQIEYNKKSHLITKQELNDLVRHLTIL